LILVLISGCSDSRPSGPIATEPAAGVVVYQIAITREKQNMTQVNPGAGGEEKNSAEESAEGALELLSPSQFEPLYASLHAALDAARGDWAVALQSMRIEVEVNEQGKVVEILDPNMNGELDNEEFALLKQIPTLRRIWLRELKITDAGLSALEGMPQLSSLSLEASNITDHGLMNLRYLSQLHTLHIERSKITGPGLIHVSCPDKIESLSFGKSPFDDAGLKLLPRFANLTFLALSETLVTDDGLSHLRACRRLDDLWLGQTAITNRGVANLIDVPALERLDLFYTGATDACLPSLLKMPNLKRVTFGGEQISVATYERLRDAHIEVEHGSLLNVRRENNLLRYYDLDFEVDTGKSSLQAFIGQGPGVTYRLEIHCTDRYVPSHMAPAYLTGPPLQLDKNWRQIVGEKFKLSYNEDDLHPILPDNPSNIYIGWHAATNNHRIDIKSRTANRFLIDWHCDAAESADGGSLPVWLNAEIPFTQLTVAGSSKLTVAEATRQASQYFDTADFEEPEIVRDESEARASFRLRPVAD
jgi:hypothetical protein